MKRVHVVVRGGVQGVGYRYTLKMVADETGISGWVRNLGDGTVESEIEGTESQIDDVLAWMAEGPPGARVDGASVTDVAAQGAAGFDVRATD